MKDIFVKHFTITLFYTTLTTFFNICEIVKVTYNLTEMEYYGDLGGNMNSRFFQAYFNS